MSAMQTFSPGAPVQVWVGQQVGWQSATVVYHDPTGIVGVRFASGGPVFLTTEARVRPAPEAAPEGADTPLFARAEDR